MSSREKWIKMICTHTHIYNGIISSHKKKSCICSNTDIPVLSGPREGPLHRHVKLDRDKYNMKPFTCGIFIMIQITCYETNRVTDIEDKFMVTKGDSGAGERELRSLGLTYMHYYI